MTTKKQKSLAGQTNLNYDKERENSKENEGLTFLYTYSWAILVVILAIASLWYFGVLKSPLDKNKPVNPNCQYVNYGAELAQYNCNEIGQALLLQISLYKNKDEQRVICSYPDKSTTNETKSTSYYNIIDAKTIFFEKCILK